MIIAVALCQVAAMAQSKATFKETTYTFELKNTGDKPLIIVDAVASCGCTRPSYTAKPIKPGKKGKVEVTFSPIGRRGTFRKTVKVRTNAVDRISTLVITGTIIPKNKD